MSVTCLVVCLPSCRFARHPVAHQPLRQNSAPSLKRYHYNPMISQNGWYMLPVEKMQINARVRPSKIA